MQDAILQGLGFGFSAGAIPGPFQTFLFLYTLRFNAARAMPLASAPLLSDGPIIVLLVLILGQVSDSFVSLISLLGAFFVFYIARGVYLQIKAGGFVLNAADAPQAGNDSFWAALREVSLINALSPGPWIFWGTVTGPLLVEFWDKSPFHALAFLCAFYVSFIGLVLVLIIVFQQTRLMGEKVVNALLRVGVLVLVIFGLLLLQRAFEGLL